MQKKVIELNRPIATSIDQSVASVIVFLIICNCCAGDEVAIIVLLTAPNGFDCITYS